MFKNEVAESSCFQDAEQVSRGSASGRFRLRSLGVNSGEVPLFGREEGELEEKGVLEFDVPLGLLPAIFPPGAGERERTASSMNLAFVGAGEEGEGMMITASFFGGDMNGNGRALSFEWKLVNWKYTRSEWGFEIRDDWRERDDIGAMGVDLIRDANAI